MDGAHGRRGALDTHGAISPIVQITDESPEPAAAFEDGRASPNVFNVFMDQRRDLVPLAGREERVDIVRLPREDGAHRSRLIPNVT